MTQCVFIIGASRTGSELLKGILEKYTDIAFVNEMHLLVPRCLRKDFKTVIDEEIGGFGAKINAKKIIQLANENRFAGYFWKEFQSKVDQEKFIYMFDHSDKQLSDVLEAAMVEKVKSEQKIIKGAKFPLHYIYTDKLIHWYPGAH